MIIFHSDNVDGAFLTLTAEDSAHCARVLRHKVGDAICVIDGEGTMYECTVTDDNVKAVCARIDKVNPRWNSHPYHLTMAVCPTKNNDRFEWFVEKATEIGVDVIAPLIGERSERKVYKTDRAAKIALSATKQSLKAAIPVVDEPVSVKEFLRKERPGQKFIAYCFDDPSAPRVSLPVALSAGSAIADASLPAVAPAPPIVSDVPAELVSNGPLPLPVSGGGHGPRSASPADNCQITILIGPEGDFSPAEAQMALEAGYIPINLGDSRLRTETAAVVAATMVYTYYIK